MILMKIFNYENLQIILKNKKNYIYKKMFLFVSIKNYYLTLKHYKYLYLWSPSSILTFFFNNIYFLNVIQNNKIDKWFILKLISLNEFIKNIN